MSPYMGSGSGTAESGGARSSGVDVSVFAFCTCGWQSSAPADCGPVSPWVAVLLLAQLHHAETGHGVCARLELEIPGDNVWDHQPAPAWLTTLAMEAAATTAAGGAGARRGGSVYELPPLRDLVDDLAERGMGAGPVPNLEDLALGFPPHYHPSKANAGQHSFPEKQKASESDVSQSDTPGGGGAL